MRSFKHFRVPGTLVGRTRSLSIKIDLPAYKSPINSSLCYHCCGDLPLESKRCSKCNRHYCSKECLKADWKQAHHFWCAKSGELDEDFVIKETVRSGLGVFANRNFSFGEKIMADHCYVIPTKDINDPDKNMSNMTPSQYAAVMKLSPVGAELEREMSKVVSHFSSPLTLKIDRNAFESEDKTLLCLNACRINHACTGANNAASFYDKTYNVMLILATRPIQKDEEILLSYHYNPHARQLYPQKYGFTCTCEGCQNPEIFDLNIARQRMMDELEQNKELTQNEQLKLCFDILNINSRLGIPSWRNGNIYDTIFMLTRGEETMKEIAYYAILSRYEQQMFIYEHDEPDTTPLYRALLTRQAAIVGPDIVNKFLKRNQHINTPPPR